ncbi:MAG: L-2-hydroxyglutarate oxidase [Methylobacter sp.]|nr:L-2-hydroxyglutarate oxidase [Methylobacter sp.]
MNHDFLIVGAGIVGLSIAREIKIREPGAKIKILEKESRLGMHASGRNSGVLHTGIYYPPDTLKAKLCKAGADAMFAYAEANNIPVRRDGKVIVATSEENAKGLDKLMANADANGIRAKRVNSDEISQIEPHARSEFGGIYCQDTAVIDSVMVLETLRAQLMAKGVTIDTDQTLIGINDEQRTAVTQNRRYSYGQLINAAGAYADQVARLAGVGQHYQLVPFKGLYYKLAPEVSGLIRSSIYPVPNEALPFLGIHFTRVINNEVYIGPTAIPALGRENYGVLSGASPIEALTIGAQLAQLYVSNPQNFRNLVHSEIPHYRKASFIAAACRLVKQLEPDWVKHSPKVGIRPQLVNTRDVRLEMDFVVEQGSHSIHVLNAISPAFTSAFAFAEWIASRFIWPVPN